MGNPLFSYFLLIFELMIWKRECYDLSNDLPCAQLDERDSTESEWNKERESLVEGKKGRG